MSNVYACPVHIDRQSGSQHHRCPLCGQGLVLLRVGATSPKEEERRRPNVDKPAPIAPAASALPDAPEAAALARLLDQVIRVLTELRDRLRDVKG